METFGDPAVWLPVVFAGLMGLAILIYVVLDGFDLGVGILLPFMPDESEKDMMVASIGPFWDANETWLVLAVGLMLVAFPAAHGAVLTALYLPVAVLLISLILRGVAFEFRAKTRAAHKHHWNRAFFIGSLGAALSQGFMLGLYIMGLEYSLATVAFALLTGVCLAAGYAFLGASWLIIKAADRLQQRAVFWAKRCLVGVVAGLGAISLASPLVSPRIFEKWFSVPEFLVLAPLPIMSVLLLGAIWVTLRHLPDRRDRFSWLPFGLVSLVFILAFTGLAYSFYPYIVPERLTIYEAASAPESLWIILLGTLVVLPTILAYTSLAYFVFRGKATALRYD